ncbi:HesA/MoeB/ThiF family protein [Aureivirga sp. CE67]|uniref:HesA/MoeB/ThiF family protein n=1 Tax=Aureivirga sp. CE67 TaxID=1788983 RepID=UPI0018CB31C6|nr:ThiF family adenylyltransferase [Aureivirga sp. CE67]
MSNSIKSLQSEKERYHKNVLYITKEQQENIKNKTILFAGVGLGSVIAESALRLGFEKFIFIDGDNVEESNLNRQNYIKNDINSPKVSSISKRLKEINPEVNITFYNEFLEPHTIERYIKDVDIAINAIDFDSLNTPFAFDEICSQNNIPVIHPLNFGWAGAAYVVTPESQQIFNLKTNNQRFELILIEGILNHYKEANLEWFNDFYTDYKKFSSQITPPQLIVGSNISAALVTNLLFQLSNNMMVKTFPVPYFLSTRI